MFLVSKQVTLNFYEVQQIYFYFHFGIKEIFKHVCT